MFSRGTSLCTACDGQDGSWRLNWQDKTLASGKIDSFDASQWHQLRLVMKGNTIRGLLDNKELTSVENNAQSAGMAFIATTVTCSITSRWPKPLSSQARINALESCRRLHIRNWLLRPEGSAEIIAELHKLLREGPLAKESPIRAEARARTDSPVSARGSW